MSGSSRAYQAQEPDPIRRRALRILKGTATYEDRFFTGTDDLLKVHEVLRTMGCVTALTMGVWDLFHHGHADYMALGKEKTREHYTDAEHIILIVGVDSDRLTKARKGDRRPIVPEDERCLTLKHLRPVDIIVLQDSMSEVAEVIPHEVRIISQSTTDLSDTSDMEELCEHLVNLAPQSTSSTSARVLRLIRDGGQQVIDTLRKDIEEAFGRAVDGLKL